MFTRRLTLAVSVFALMAGTAHADYTLHILHTNDLHSRIEPINKYDSTCGEKDKAENACFGGVARVAVKIRQLRDELAGENVLVLDAGDQFQGSLMFNTYKGKAEAEFMEAIGYDVMAVGNHEFDNGPEGMLPLLDTVSFPVISGNLDLTSSNVLKDKISDHVVVEVGGEKIGIVSALATDTDVTSSPGPSVVFQDEIEALKGDVATLQEQGIDKIIALNHVGVNKDMAIAAAVPGLDAVVGGHSHTLFSNTEEGAMAYPTMVDGVPVVQAYAYSKYLGHLTLEFDDEGNLKSATGDTILLDASVPEDEVIVARVAELAGPIEELRNKVVASSADVIDGSRETCRAVECSMGNLVADAMLARVRDQGIDIAIQNGGGVRASIDAGDVTMGEVLTVLPFQNTLSTFQVKGDVILAALENGVSEVEEGAGRFPQVSGLTFAFDPKAPAGSRVSDVMIGGEPIDPAKDYGVVSNNYVRTGGDGYKMFIDAANPYDFGPDLADVVAEYMAGTTGGYKPYTDGRIVIK